MKRNALLLILGLAACRQGDGQAFAIQFNQLNLGFITPSEGGVANRARPLLRWTPVPNAVVYRVSVYGDLARKTIFDIQFVAGTETRVRPELPDGIVVYAEFEAYDVNGKSLFASGMVEFRMRIVPDWIPDIGLTTHDPLLAYGGYRIFSLTDARPPNNDNDLRIPALLLMNRWGEILWWYRHPGVGVITDARVRENGNILFIYRDPVAGAGRTSEAFEITWDGTVVWKSPDGTFAHHEVSVGPGGNYLYMIWTVAQSQGIDVEGDGIEIRDANNNLLWEWNIFDHFDPIDWPTEEMDRPGISGLGVDWSHANSATWDPDRSMIWMSVRHFDNLVGIDYPSGDVRVIIGADGLGGASMMDHQHAPEIQADGTILLFDNGNGRGYSRVTIIEWDEMADTARNVFVWRDDPDMFDPAVGDADRLPNGNILITSGVTGRLIEITPIGDIVWDMRLVNSRFWIYRADDVPMERIPGYVFPFD